MTEPAYEPWLRRARSNLAIARIGKSTDVMFEDLCFEAQQAAEKAPKALLLYLSGDCPRTHAFALLLTRLEQQLSVPPAIREVVELTDYAVQVRYPGDYYPVSEEVYRRAVALAECARVGHRPGPPAEPRRGDNIGCLDNRCAALCSRYPTSSITASPTWSMCSTRCFAATPSTPRTSPAPNASWTLFNCSRRAWRGSRTGVCCWVSSPTGVPTWGCATGFGATSVLSS